jgi:hypothetical protein
MNSNLTHTAVLQFSYTTEKYPDTDSPPAVQLPNWTFPWHTQPPTFQLPNWKISWHRLPSCSSITQLNNPLTHTALVQLSYKTEKSPDTHSPPAVQSPNWTISWHRQPSCSSITQLFSITSTPSPQYYPRSFISIIVFLLPCITNSQ